MTLICKKETTIVNGIINRAQNEILNQAGIDVILMPRYSSKLVAEDLKKTFESMCNSWGVSLSWVSNKSRADDRPIMRKLLWMVGKSKYPSVPYYYLASLTGTTNHAGVIKGIRNGYNWLEIQDEKFLKYYELVRVYFEEQLVA